MLHGLGTVTGVILGCALFVYLAWELIRAFRKGAPAVLLAFTVSCRGVENGLPVRPGFDSALTNAIAARYADGTAINAVVSNTARNQVTEDLLYLVDRAYYDFEADLYKGGATFSTVSDTILIALGGVGALIASPEVKSILAVTSAGLAGVRASISENFLQEQTLHAIIAKMRAGRAVKLLEIRSRRDQPLEQYSMSMALSDIEQYFNAGTVVGALRQIVTESGVETLKAEEALR